MHGHLDEYELEEIAEDVYLTDEDEKQTTWSKKTVKLSKLVERGHLHVLQFLHAEFQNGLQRYCKPAIQHGQLEILVWLNKMGYMKPKDKFHNLFDFFLCAVQTGNVKALNWLLSKDFDFKYALEPEPMDEAIRSKSIEMIQVCHDLDHSVTFTAEKAIRETKSVHVYRKLHELGYDFKEFL